MYPYIQLFGTRIPTYFICGCIGLVVTFSFLNGLLLERLLVRKYNKEIIFSTIGLFIGSRLFGIIGKFLYEYYSTGSINIITALRGSGIVYFGGLIGYLGTLLTICNLRKKDFKEISNIIAVCIPLFHSFGRIGCYFGGCCYGIKSESIIALPYRTCFEDTFVKRIPTQIMEAGFEMLMFYILLRLYRIKLKKGLVNNNAKLLKTYLLIYSVWRFVIEFWRGDYMRGVFRFISYSQLICILIIIIIIFRKEKRNG